MEYISLYLTPETVTIVISAFIIPVLIRIGGYITTWLAVKTQDLSEKIKRDDTKKAVEDATNVIEDIINSIDISYVEDLKKEGKFDIEAHKIAFGKALEKSKYLITDKIKKCIEEVYGDFEGWLVMKIDSICKKKKSEK